MTSQQSTTESRPNDEEVVHEYDGIQECDNQLPRWWLYTFYGTIVFAAIYYFHYEKFRGGEYPAVAYARESAAVRAAAVDKAQHDKPMSPETLLALAGDSTSVAKGRDIFVQTCAPCHGADGGGNIGPNLTDEFWIHGGKPVAIYTTISTGVASKGMPAWGPQLGGDRVQAVTAYILTIRNSKVTGGKAPQGDREP